MKLNLVVDISGIFYRSLYTVKNAGQKKGEKLLDTKKSQGIFMRKLVADFSTLVKSIDSPSRVIVAIDSSSWRKQLIIEDGGYKITREKKDDDPVNWTNFYDLTSKFCDILSSKGYILSKVHEAEADDLLYFWSRELNEMKQNVILITGDRDLLQVVQQHPNGSWTIALDPVNARKKISLVKETLDYSKSNSSSSSETDIFNPDSWNTSEDILKKVINSYDLQVVDVQKFCTKKVILGDNGDSVPSIVSWRDKKDETKIRTMTENNYEKILEIMPSIETTPWQDICESNIIETISSKMETLKKIEVNRETVEHNMQRNIKLVILSHSTIPFDVYDRFKKHYDIVSLENPVPLTGIESILGGSEWWSADSKSDFIPKSFDLFGDV